MYINFVPDLFLEVQELTRFKESLDDNGFRKQLLQDSISFGLIKTAALPSFANGRVERDLDNALNQKTIKIGALAAIDNEGLFVYSPQINNLVVPSDNSWYWVKAKHAYSTVELGKVTIDASGNLTGVGTEFTKVLRGNPNFASVIRFINAVGNTLEYEVLEVISDTSAIIVHPTVSGGAADFVAEGNLQYSVVGTFTEGVAVPGANKNPFKYDAAEIELVPEIAANVRPAYVIGQEFYLARVRVTSGNLVLQDKRTDFWQSKGSDSSIRISRVANPLIGVEAAKWQNDYTAGDRNIVEVAWSMRSKNWTVDSSQNIVTFLGGSEGGSFKSVTDFTDGDFNGMRLYYPSGKYSIITNSIKQGAAINLYTDTLDVDEVSNDGGTTFTGEQLLVAPDCEEVQLRWTANPIDLTYNVDDIFIFPTNTAIAKCFPTVYNDLTCKYNLQYRYKSFKEFTEWTPINDGKYFTEKSFTAKGALKGTVDRVEYTYVADPTAAFIQLEISPNSLRRFKELVYKGDIIGVNTITGFSAGQVLNLRVGIDKRYQYVTGNLSISDDVYISLSNLNAVEGNEFRIHFDCQSLLLGGNSIHIVDNYAGGTVNIVKTITQADVYAMLNQDGGIVIDCLYDDNDQWIAYQNYDTGQPLEVKIFSGELGDNFDGSGMGKIKGWFGHSLMNGNNGTENIEDRFILATSNPLKMKTTGGADQVILDLENVPPHDHKVQGRSADRNTSGGGYAILQVHLNGPDGVASTNTTKAGGKIDGTTKPVSIKPKNYALAYVQKLY